MTRSPALARLASTAAGAALVGVAAGLAAHALGRGSAIGAAAGTVVAGAAAFSLLRPVRRRFAVLAAALAAVGCVVAVGRVHEAMRGEGGGDFAERPRLPPSASRGLADERGVRFAVWSDCRGDVRVFERVLDSIRSRAPAFHVGLGDLVGMARPYQFEILRDRLDGARLPYFVLPGNHDRNPDGSLDAFRRVFGPPDRDLTTRHAVLVALDTSAGRLDLSEVERAERLLGERELTVAEGLPRRHAIVFSHYPVFPPTSRPDKALPSGPEVERLRALLRARRATVFSGNWHAYDVLDLGGHFQVVTGGAGSKPEWDGPYHYVWVEADEAGVRFERVDVAPPSEASPALHRWRTFLDEAPWAPRVAPLATLLAFAALATALGAAVAVIPRRAQRGETDTSA